MKDKSEIGSPLHVNKIGILRCRNFIASPKIRVAKKYIRPWAETVFQDNIQFVAQVFARGTLRGSTAKTEDNVGVLIGHEVPIPQQQFCFLVGVMVTSSVPQRPHGPTGLSFRQSPKQFPSY